MRSNFSAYRQRTYKYALTHNIKEKKAERHTPDNQEISEVLTEKGYVRQLMVKPSRDYLKAKPRMYFLPQNAKTSISAEKQVETTFGFIKDSFGFTRYYL